MLDFKINFNFETLNFKLMILILQFIIFSCSHQTKVNFKFYWNLFNQNSSYRRANEHNNNMFLICNL